MPFSASQLTAVRFCSRVRSQAARFEVFRRMCSRADARTAPRRPPRRLPPTLRGSRAGRCPRRQAERGDGGLSVPWPQPLLLSAAVESSGVSSQPPGARTAPLLP